MNGSPIYDVSVKLETNPGGVTRRARLMSQFPVEELLTL